MHLYCLIRVSATRIQKITLLPRSLLTTINETTVEIESAGHVSVTQSMDIQSMDIRVDVSSFEILSILNQLVLTHTCSKVDFTHMWYFCKYQNLENRLNAHFSRITLDVDGSSLPPKIRHQATVTGST